MGGGGEQSCRPNTKLHSTRDLTGGLPSFDACCEKESNRLRRTKLALHHYESRQWDAVCISAMTPGTPHGTGAEY